MSPLVAALLLNLLLVLGLMFLLWIVSVAKRDVSIVDPCWGLGFVILAWATLLQVDQPTILGWLIVVLVSLWGLRLTFYLSWRNFGKDEDRRYQAMRGEARPEVLVAESVHRVLPARRADVDHIDIDPGRHLLWR